jgi:hypothetical protein
MVMNFGKKYMAMLAFGFEPIENGLSTHSSILNGDSQPTNLLKLCSSLLESMDRVGKEMR